MTTRKQKRTQRGGQPLSYTNPRYAEASSLPANDLLYSTGQVARPAININQQGGNQRAYTDTGVFVPWTQVGAPLVIQRQTGGQPLSYTNPHYSEASSLPTNDLLYSAGSLARPEIGQKGGFSPSIMTNLVGNAAYLTPLAMTAAYRLWSNRTRKQRGGTAEEWEQAKQQAKLMLQSIAPGKANGKYINKVAKLIKEKKNTSQLLEEFKVDKGIDVDPKNRPRFATKLDEWEFNQKKAKRELAKYGEPTAVEVTQLAALRTGRKGKEGNANLYLTQFEQQQVAKKIGLEALSREKEEKRIQKQIREAGKLSDFQKPKVEKPKVEKPKPSINERPWNQIRKEARNELYTYKKVMKRGNVMKYASMKRLKNYNRQKSFMDDFQRRDPARSAESTPEFPSSSNEEFRKNRKPTTVKKGREEWKSYQSGARKMLGRIGDATIAEISVLAKMMKEGENIRPYLNEFEQRVKRTEVREAKLEEERNRNNRPVESIVKEQEPIKASVPEVKASVPEVKLSEVKQQAPQLIPEVKGAPVPAIKAVRPIDIKKFGEFRQRMEELAKKYPLNP